MSVIFYERSIMHHNIVAFPKDSFNDIELACAESEQEAAMLASYWKQFADSGTAVVVIPENTHRCAGCDGPVSVFNSETYTQTCSPACEEWCMQEFFEQQRHEIAAETNIPQHLVW